MIKKFQFSTENSAKDLGYTQKVEPPSKSYEGELTIDSLSLRYIELDPENSRNLTITLEDAVNGLNKDDPLYEKKRTDWLSLESLANSIKDGQLINPIFVYRYGERCRLIAGERRTLASAIAGKKNIMARITSQKPKGLRLRVLQWAENNERSDLTLSERVVNLEYIISEYKKENAMPKVTARALGELTGMSLTQAQRYLVVIQAPKEVKNAVLSNTIDNIKVVELICREKDVGQRKKLLDAAISGGNLDKLKKLSRSFNSVLIPRISRKEATNSRVALGKAHPNALKKVFEAVVDSEHLNENVSNEIRKSLKTPGVWTDVKQLERLFKATIRTLEKEHKETA